MPFNDALDHIDKGGYRCPANIDLFREVVDQLSAALEMRQILSSALDQPVKSAVYMNL